MTDPLGEAYRKLRPEQFRPRDLTDEQLVAMDHAEWVESFAKIMAIPTKVEMTPRRLGVITRLQWAARFIRLLQTLVKKQEEELIGLKHRDQDREKVLGDAMATIRRLKFERDQRREDDASRGLPNG